MTTTQSGYETNENDLYETEPWAVDALFRVFPDFKCCWFWEPSAGNHAIADRARDEHGCSVFTSDIETYNREHDAIVDFFKADVPKLSNIITNPPYGKQNHTAAKYARRALECADVVALLLTAGFDSGSSRTDLFRDNKRFMGKIVLLDRLILIPGTDKSGTVDHAWYVWGPEHDCRPAIYYERKV